MSVRTLLSAVAVAGFVALAPPAIAAETLEESLGVTPGLYSKGQLVHLATLGDESPAEIQSILGNPMGPLAHEQVAQMEFAVPEVAPVKKTLHLSSVSVKVAPGAN